jgi:hypothetical protein
MMSVTPKIYFGELAQPEITRTLDGYDGMLGAASEAPLRGR